MADLLLAMKGPSYFLNNFGFIENPQTFTEERFKLWEYQEEVLLQSHQGLLKFFLFF